MLLMGGLLTLSAFFSSTETALFSLTPETARRLKSNHRLEQLLSILRHEPQELLTAILFGNLIVNVLFFCSGAATVGHLGAAHNEWFEALGGAIILLSVILFGEIVPKAIGINHAAGVLRLASTPVKMWFTFTLPFRHLIRWLLRVLHLSASASGAEAYLTPGELKELLDAVHHEPGFGLQEKEILEDIVNLSEVRVREVMIPRVKVLRKSVSAPRKEMLEEARRDEYSHVLVYQDKDDDPLGYVSIGDLSSSETENQPLESMVHPLVFVPETKRADVLLRQFMENGWKLVAVVDEYGGLAGIVTVEDLFAEVIGEFEPEAVEEMTKLDDSTYRLHGSFSIRSWRELFTGLLAGQEIEALAFDTLGGLVISLLGRMPVPGDTVFVRNLRLTVETMHHRRVETVLLHLNKPEEGV